MEIILDSFKSIKSKNFEKTDRIVICLHGYGSCGKDYQEVGEIFLSRKLDNSIFLFPDAPYNCDIGIGYQWFNLDNEITYNSVRDGLEKTGPILNEYIQKVSDKFKCDNINLLGFSQGAIISFEMLYFSDKISKIVAFSGLFANNSKKEIHSKDVNILISHSDDDEVVPYKNAINSKNQLDKLNIKSKIITYQNIGHSISIEGWNEAIEFLKESKL